MVAVEAGKTRNGPETIFFCYDQVCDPSQMRQICGAPVVGAKARCANQQCMHLPQVQSCT